MHTRRYGLLIVPYGIETSCFGSLCSFAELLIVPYGIETTKVDTSSGSFSLLIVPYGIETFELALEAMDKVTSNRTLWN